MEYTCSLCGQAFESDWSEEEAKAEAKEKFGDESDPETDQICCDNCFEVILYWNEEQS